MHFIRKSAALALVLAMGFGWFTYPYWYYVYYSNAPEQYAYPASLTGPHDPHWGFWRW
jgi:hypothetical protein